MSKNFIYILISFIFLGLASFALAQASQVDINNLFLQILNALQKIATTEKPQISPPPSLQLPRGTKPAISFDRLLTTSTLSSILPDEDKSDDIDVQLNNVKVTKVLTQDHLPKDLQVDGEKVKGVVFVIRQNGWGCSVFSKEENSTSSCSIDLRRSLSLREIPVIITEDSDVLSKNNQEINISDLKPGDTIDVSGNLDPDNLSVRGDILKKLAEGKIRVCYDIGPGGSTLEECLENAKKLEEKYPGCKYAYVCYNEFGKPTSTIPIPTSTVGTICAQVVTPAYNPENPSECREFPTPCDVPSNWVRTPQCPVTSTSPVSVTSTPTTTGETPTTPSPFCVDLEKLKINMYAYDPNNPKNCIKLKTLCDVPSNWIKTYQCPSSQ
jgi:hypothetical protein